VVCAGSPVALRVGLESAYRPPYTKRKKSYVKTLSWTLEPKRRRKTSLELLFAGRWLI
jgi:hypothetical protein